MKIKNRKKYGKKLKKTFPDENVIKEIENTRKKIREKFSLLKNESRQSEKLNESFFSPINREIREIGAKINSPFIKREKATGKTPKVEKKEIKIEKPKSPVKGDYDSEEEQNGQMGNISNSLYKSMISEGDSDQEVSDEEVNSTLIGKSGTNKFIQSYLNSYESTDPGYDRTYGPVRDSSGQWHLGSENFNYDHSHFKIGNGKFEITPGLTKLIFLNVPTGYTQQDLDQYKEILEASNVHRRDYMDNSQVNGNRGYKYTNIIKKIVKMERKTNKQHGKGLKIVLFS